MRTSITSYIIWIIVIVFAGLFIEGAATCGVIFNHLHSFWPILLQSAYMLLCICIGIKVAESEPEL